MAHSVKNRPQTKQAPSHPYKQFWHSKSRIKKDNLPSTNQQQTNPHPNKQTHKQKTQQNKHNYSRQRQYQQQQLISNRYTFHQKIENKWGMYYSIGGCWGLLLGAGGDISSKTSFFLLDMILATYCILAKLKTEVQYKILTFLSKSRGSFDVKNGSFN
jgi:hypothetical protein